MGRVLLAISSACDFGTSTIPTDKEECYQNVIPWLEQLSLESLGTHNYKDPPRPGRLRQMARLGRLCFPNQTRCRTCTFDTQAHLVLEL